MASFKLTITYIAVFGALMVALGIGSEAPASAPNEASLDGPYADPKAVLADADDGQGNDGDKDKYLLPPEPSPGFYMFLENCGKKLDMKCTDDIFLTLFNRTDIDRYCCGDIIEMGKKCHDGYVFTLSRIDKYKEFASVLPKRGEWLWNYCQKIGGAKREKPQPPLPRTITGGKIQSVPVKKPL